MHGIYKQKMYKKSAGKYICVPIRNCLERALFSHHILFSHCKIKLIFYTCLIFSCFLRTASTCRSRSRSCHTLCVTLAIAYERNVYAWVRSVKHVHAYTSAYSKIFYAWCLPRRIHAYATVLPTVLEAHTPMYVSVWLKFSIRWHALVRYAIVGDRAITEKFAPE